MSDVSLSDLCIAYALLPFLTPARTRLLLETFEPLSAATRASTAFLRGLLSIDAAQAETVRNPLRSEAARTMVQSLRASTVTLHEPHYPTLLKEIIDPPLALFYRGDLAIASRPAVAVVGSRRASVYAENAAAHLTRQLVTAGVVIVSGLARGIDAAAHEAALEASGSTVAVLGTGLDLVYPRSHKALFRAIEERGLILTEFGPGTPPLAGNFPMRNRIISGLSLGTVIVEATSRSGSLITARTAAEQGREVFAVPGSIFADGSEGTHRLIQYGAKLVHDVDDILDELPGGLRAAGGGQRLALPDSPLREVLEVFRRDEATHIDDAAQALASSIPALSNAILQLELGGWLRALPGSRYVRAR